LLCEEPELVNNERCVEILFADDGLSDGVFLANDEADVGCNDSRL
jgi:hypothetical protein